MMNRILQNLTTTNFALRRHFPPPVLDAIESAIQSAEGDHSGEIQFAIECSLGPWQLLRGVSARDEAIAAFSDLRVWDTQHNSGVLIYVLLAEHDIEIVADRGYSGQVSTDEWREVCRMMEREFAAGNFLAGSVAGIEAISALIRGPFPKHPDDIDERPNRPVIL